MKFTFKDDWRHILRNAWSMRLAMLAAVLSGVEVVFNVMTALEIIPHFMPPGVFAALAGLASAGAFLARILAQKEFPQ